MVCLPNHLHFAIRGRGAHPQGRNGARHERSGGAAQRLDATAGAEPPRAPATMGRGWAHVRHVGVMAVLQSSLVAVPVLVGLFEAQARIQAEGWGVVAHYGQVGLVGALLAAPVEEMGYQTAAQALVAD